MPALSLDIILEPERLDEGAAEERAAFGMLVIESGSTRLTEGFDAFIKNYRKGPLISGYHLAEWIAWNWWRLRWEPRSAAADWAFAHQMNTIGEGYIWPNVIIFSDGVRTALISEPSRGAEKQPFKYTGAYFPVVVPSEAFEHAIDDFIPQVLGRLRQNHIGEKNLDRIWQDVLSERADPRSSRRRRLEALLGRDADAIEDGMVDRLLEDTQLLGETAIDELAAERAQTDQSLLSAHDFMALAKDKGFDADPHSAVRLDNPSELPKRETVPAWKLGAAAARLVRQQERLSRDPISDDKLAQMAGTSKRVISRKSYNNIRMSFQFSKHDTSKIVLRSKWEAGRRFELARLVGDNILSHAGNLHPATRTSTYRQKAQRSFAAELLSPIDAIDDMLRGDYSDEKQQEAAEYFTVSTMTINTSLANHRRIERDENFEEEFDMITASNRESWQSAT